MFYVFIAILLVQSVDALLGPMNNPIMFYDTQRNSIIFGGGSSFQFYRTNITDNATITMAGVKNTYGFNNGNGSTALLYYPTDIAPYYVNGSITAYVFPEQNNNCVRIMSAEFPFNISTFAGNCTSQNIFMYPCSLARTANNEYMVADYGSHKIVLVTANKTLITVLSTPNITNPRAIAFLGNTLFIADYSNRLSRLYQGIHSIITNIGSYTKLIVSIRVFNNSIFAVKYDETTSSIFMGVKFIKSNCTAPNTKSYDVVLLNNGTLIGTQYTGYFAYTLNCTLTSRFSSTRSLALKTRSKSMTESSMHTASATGSSMKTLSSSAGTDDATSSKSKSRTRFNYSESDLITASMNETRTSSGSKTISGSRSETRSNTQTNIDTTSNTETQSSIDTTSNTRTFLRKKTSTTSATSDITVSLTYETLSRNALTYKTLSHKTFSHKTFSHKTFSRNTFSLSIREKTKAKNPVSDNSNSISSRVLGVSLMNPSGAKVIALSMILADDCGSTRDLSVLENPLQTRFVFFGNLLVSVAILAVVTFFCFIIDRHFRHRERSLLKIIAVYKIVEIAYFQWNYFLPSVITSFVKYNDYWYDKVTIFISVLAMVGFLCLLGYYSLDSFDITSTSKEDEFQRLNLSTILNNEVDWLSPLLMKPLMEGFRMKKGLAFDILFNFAISMITFLESCKTFSIICVVFNTIYLAVFWHWRLVQPRVANWTGLLTVASQNLAIIMKLGDVETEAIEIFIYVMTVICFILMLLPKFHREEKKHEPSLEEMLIHDVVLFSLPDSKWLQESNSMTSSMTEI